MLFRGFFHKCNDKKRRKINVECAFCTCQPTWDLQAAFCPRRDFGYHLDEEVLKMKKAQKKTVQADEEEERLLEDKDDNMRNDQQS